MTRTDKPGWSGTASEQPKDRSANVTGEHLPGTLMAGGLPVEAVPVFGGSGKKDLVEKLSGRDWVAIVFAGLVLVIIVFASAVIFHNWSTPVPDLSRVPVDQQRDAIERFKELNAVLGERTEKMFDLTVTKALLPLLSTLVGFILGTKTRHSN